MKSTFANAHITTQCYPISANNRNIQSLLFPMSYSYHATKEETTQTRSIQKRVSNAVTMKRRVVVLINPQLISRVREQRVKNECIIVVDID